MAESAGANGGGSGAPSEGRDGTLAQQRGDGQAGRGRGRGRGGGGGGGGSRARGRGDSGATRGSPGRGRGRGRGWGGISGRPPPASGHDSDNSAQPPAPEALAAKSAVLRARTETEQDVDDAEQEICFICANPIVHYSVAPCNHITCHTCSLRMRALYKNKECPHCRTLAPFVCFTDESTKRFEDQPPATSEDTNIGIRYANEDIVGDTVILLRYNCPDPECPFAGLGWPDLHRHVRSAHHKKLCDLCTRNKMAFTHEHVLFSDKELNEHMRHGDDRPGAPDQTGFKGHPLCSFCGQRFYDDDRLYEHCRSRHERCFICDRQTDSRQPHYYRDYAALEDHFKNDHFPCSDRECLEKKFVVFGSEVDLQAHQLEEHGKTLSKDSRRDARTVDLSAFDVRQSYTQVRRGGRGGRRGEGGGDRREQQQQWGRDPNTDPLPLTSAQPLRRDELAFYRQMDVSNPPTSASSAPSTSQQPSSASRPSGGGSSTQQNTSAQGRQRQQQPPPQDSLSLDSLANIGATDLSSLTPEQRASLTRHGAVIERAANLLGNDATKMAAFRGHVSSYNRGSMTPVQLIDAFTALFAETSQTALGTLVREVADLFDASSSASSSPSSATKGEALRRAWQDRRSSLNAAVAEDYPSLPSLGGMRGAATSSTGWASAAAATAATAGAALTSQQQQQMTRMLKLKSHSSRAAASSGGVGRATTATTAPGTTTARFQPSWGSSLGGRTVAATTPSPAFPALPSTRSVPGAEAAAPRPAAQPGWVGGGAGTNPTGRGTAVAARESASSGTPSITMNTASSATPLSLLSSSSLSATTATASPATGTRASTAGGGFKKPPAVASRDAFPSLPAAPKPQTTIFARGNTSNKMVRRNFGVARDTGFSWTAGGGSGGGGGQADDAKIGVGGDGGGDDENSGNGGGGGGGGGKKKKGKKQVLVQWG